MPSAPSPLHPRNGITKLTNCRLLVGDSLARQDLWISSSTGKVIKSQAAFYDEFLVPDETIDLGGRIVSPGFIDCQLNGAFGFNFSTLFDDMSQYGKKLREPQPEAGPDRCDVVHPHGHQPDERAVSKGW